jgi:signal recognition particle subunit SRP54
MASLDIYRPAAMEQLAVLGRDLDIPTLPIVAGQKPAQIASARWKPAKLGGYDVVLLDTAGRTTLDEEMMTEAAEIKTSANPHEVLLVADSPTGQDAVNLARSFDERVGLTGIVLTRVDGDGRGGAALSMRAVTGKPIKLIGTGEKTDALEDFHPSRIAAAFSAWATWCRWSRKPPPNIDAEKAARVAEKDAQGPVRSCRHARATFADGEYGRHLRPDGHDAGHRENEEPDRQRRPRRQDPETPGRR